jgi:hypothetical protein
MHGIEKTRYSLPSLVSNETSIERAFRLAKTWLWRRPPFENKSVELLRRLWNE